MPFPWKRRSTGTYARIGIVGVGMPGRAEQQRGALRPQQGANDADRHAECRQRLQLI